MWTASTQEIHDIYYQNYWLPRCPKLHPGVDLIYFNICVNAGPGRAEAILWKAVGGTDQETVDKFDQLVMAFYRGLAQFSRYGKGWTAREGRIHAAALKMLTAQPAPAPVTAAPTPVKETPMATTTTTADPIAQAIATLESLKTIVGIAANFVPPPWNTVAANAIPVLEEGLTVIQQAKSKSGFDLFAAILQGVHDIAGHVQTLAASTQKAVAAPTAPAS